MGEPSHRRRIAAEAEIHLRCAIITISDTRTVEDDVSGDLITRALTDDGHEVSYRTIVPDDGERILSALDEALALNVAVIVTNGGTGIAQRDVTFESLEGRLQRRLPGFGELFRALSFPEIGPAAMLTRATAGTIADTLIFVLPGSPHAVETALDRLILPDLPHLAWEITRR